MPIVINLSLTLVWRVARETTNSIHIYRVHFLVGVTHQWITPTKGNGTGTPNGKAPMHLCHKVGERDSAKGPLAPERATRVF